MGAKDGISPHPQNTITIKKRFIPETHRTVDTGTVEFFHIWSLFRNKIHRSFEKNSSWHTHNPTTPQKPNFQNLKMEMKLWLHTPLLLIEQQSTTVTPQTIATTSLPVPPPRVQTQSPNPNPLAPEHDISKQIMTQLQNIWKNSPPTYT